MKPALAVVFWLCAAAAAAAPSLDLPGTAKVLTTVEENGTHALATGPFDGSAIPFDRIEGRINRQSWRILQPPETSFDVLAALRGQIVAAGYSVIYECADTACGGFDFRFGIEVIPAPDMHVDLHDFRYLAARADSGEALSLLVSRSGQAAYVQMIAATPGAAPPVPPKPVATTAEPAAPAPAITGDLAARLVTDGHAVLDDLVFESGSSNLGNGSFETLKALAAFMKLNPKARIAIVGHTDSIGKLSRNITLSKRRARSVRTRLTQTHGIRQDRMQAEGMGYLAPVATNLTEAGRVANRRVEVILLAM